MRNIVSNAFSMIFEGKNVFATKHCKTFIFFPSQKTWYLFSRGDCSRTASHQGNDWEKISSLMSRSTLKPKGTFLFVASASIYCRLKILVTWSVLGLVHANNSRTALNLCTLWGVYVFWLPYPSCVGNFSFVDCFLSRHCLLTVIVSRYSMVAFNSPTQPHHAATSLYTSGSFMTNYTFSM